MHTNETKESGTTKNGAGKFFIQLANSSTFKGAVAGAISAVIITSVMSAKPANATATVLLGPLATIEGMINQYMGVMQDYANQWIGDITGLVDDDVWHAARTSQSRIDEAIGSSTRDLAEHHAIGTAPYLTSMQEQLAPLRRADGSIDPLKAAERLAPPQPFGQGEMNDERLSGIWEHALLITGDEPLPEVRNSRRDTLEGSQYEYHRIQTLQARMLAQDSIQRYPLEGPRMEGYRDHLQQLQGGSTMASMSPGQLMAAQLDVAVKVQASAAIDQLESSLRQERMLGTLLAQELKPDVDRLLQGERN